MFGRDVDDKGMEGWLDLLRQAEPETRRGELVARNLLEDANVCSALHGLLNGFLDGETIATTPDDAARQYDRFPETLAESGAPCQHPENTANQLPGAPFEQLARAVDGNAFVKYNYLPTNKRKVPRHHRASPAVKTKIRLRELATRGVRIEDLRGSIGKDVVFATSHNIAMENQRGAVSVDEMRDRLGLDDAGPFGRDGFMVIYVYGAHRVSEGRFYRPTVLDAGWKGAGIAFLPSPPNIAQPDIAQPGRTQNLATGEPAEPEVLHAAIAAAEVEVCLIAGPLTQNPPETYKAIRLTGKPTSES